MIIRRQAFYQVRKLFKIDRLTSKVVATFSFLIFMNQIYWVYSVHLTSLSWKAVLVLLSYFCGKKNSVGEKIRCEMYGRRIQLCCEQCMWICTMYTECVIQIQCINKNFHLAQKFTMESVCGYYPF